MEHINKEPLTRYQIIFAYMFSGINVYCEQTSFRSASDCLNAFNDWENQAIKFRQDDIDSKAETPTRHTSKILEIVCYTNIETISMRVIDLEKLTLKAEKEKANVA